MSAPRSVETLAEAAHLYYIEGLSQQQVASALSTTRSNVSRMLQAARDMEIVRFQVVHPLHRQRALEQSLIEHFGLREALVLAADAGTEPLQQVGELGAKWLIDHVKDGMTLTLSWGRTLRALARALQVDKAYDVNVVQLGGDLQLEPQVSGHELVRELAARLGGRYSYLHAPAILDSPAMVEELRTLRPIRAELDKARSADLALVGIGGYGQGFAAQLLESAHLTRADRDAFDAQPPAGDILARFYDDRGEQVDGPLRHRVLALELDELREIPTIVGIAAGEVKSRGILGALRGGLVDVLITDQPAAATALSLERASLERGRSS
jgi:DNA-binding transcriptional regulator LsrR (DeoR family)